MVLRIWILPCLSCHGQSTQTQEGLSVVLLGNKHEVSESGF